MGYKTTTTRISSAKSTKSRQTTSYQYPSGNGVVLAGSTINSQTTAYLDVTVPGQARAFTAVSGGGTTTIISNLQYLDTNNIVTNAIAVSTTGGNILINGNGFANTSRVYVNNQLVTNTFVNSNAIIATLSANSVGNVSLAIFNSSGQSGVFSNSNVRFSGAPSWVSSGAISSYNDVASNIALEASGDGTLTYSLQSGSGSLPSGISLVSTGYLSGTATGYTSDTVFTFTLVVTDAEGQAAQQNYSYTVFIGDTYFKQTSLLLSADTANTFISDSSTNNFLVSRFGDTRPSRFSPYWPGGWSGYFDGTGDNLTVPSSSNLAFGTGNFCVEMWYYQLSNAQAGLYSNAVSSAGGDAQFEIQIAATTFYPILVGWNTIFLTSNTASTANRWNHLVVCRSGTTASMFLNGTRVATATVNNNFSSTNAFYIGAQAASSSPVHLNGYISNLRVVKGSAIYDPTQTTITVPTTALTTVANTSLLTLRDSILADDSPNNFTITRNGDTKLTTFSPFNTAPYTFTANSNSVYFDGTGDYLSVPDNTVFDFGSGNFTIETWMYPTATGDRRIYSQWSAGTDQIFLRQDSVTPGTLRFASTTGGSTQISMVSTQTVTTNSWSHIAIVRNGNVFTFYINGQSAGSSTAAITLPNIAANVLISSYDGSNEHYIGYLSNFRVLKGTAQYTANFTPSTTALTSVANTSLLTCQSTTIVDNSSNNFAITVNGNPNVSIVNPFGENVSTISNYTWTANSYSASGYFDGTGDYLTVPYNTAIDTTSSNFTIEAWVYRAVAGAAHNIWSQRSDTPTSGGEFRINSDNTIQVFYTGGSTVTSTGYTVAANTWTHIATTRSGTTVRLFINGNQVGSSTFSNGTATANTVAGRIGIDSSGSSAMNGYISNFRLLKGTALYTGPFIPPAAPLTAVANTSILTLQTDVGSNSVQFVDQSAQNNLITRNGNASQGAYSPLVPSTWSAYFDGTSDTLTAADNIAFAPGTSDFTLEFWAYSTDTASSTRAAFDTRSTAASTTGFYFRTEGTSQYIYGRGSSILLTVSGRVNNTWQHIVLVRSSGTVTIYIDGVSKGTVTDTTNLTDQKCRISGFVDTQASPYAWLGYLSNIRVLKGTAQYTANFTPATTTIGPVANTSLLTLREPILADNSGNNFTITPSGDTKIVPFGPFSPQTVTPDSYSYRFSNASDYISTTNSNLALGTNDWTIESWVYPRFTANSGIFQISNVQYGLTNSNLNTVALGFSSGNKAIVRVANASYTSTGTSITANAWTHLALVKSSNVSKLYINGTLDSTIGTSGSITDTVNYTGTTNIAVGGYGSTSALANAYISNFRVVSNSAVYTQNFTVNTGPISAISGTTLLTCQANTIVDSSLANLTITANANVTPSKFNPFDETVTVGQTYSGASAGGSAYFDGTGDYLTVPDSPSLRLSTGTAWTIEGHIYLNNIVSGDNGIISKRQATNEWQLNIHPSFGYLNFWNGTTTYQSNITLVVGQWYHVAVTWDTTTLRFFVNGTPGTTHTGVTFTSSTNQVQIGAILGANFFNGYISNLRLINGTAVYTRPFVPPTTPALPTTANTSLLLNFTNSGVVDATGRNVLETVNDARVTTSLSKYGSGSYYFDGTGDYMYVMGTSSEMAFGTGDFTVEFWVYPVTANQNAIIIDSRPYNTNGAYITLYLNSGGVTLNTSNTDRISGGAVTASSWSHIALARSSGVTKLFLNGTQTGSNYTDTTAYLNGASRPVMGVGGFDLTTYPLNGYIDDLRITKGYARYTANFTAPTAPFVTK